jgi:NAD(P)-dependent dehydrogenase (short-subunit alcohol dehydrogenase family)
VSDPDPIQRAQPDAARSAQLEAAADVLEAIIADRGVLADAPDALRKRLLTAAGRVSLPLKHERKMLARELRRRRKSEQLARDEERRLSTGIRQLREHPVFVTPDSGAPKEPLGPSGDELELGRRCYVCKQEYTTLHAFYDQLCVPCGDFNYSKRDPKADLSGRVALVSGARVKIGYQAAIQLLRARAHVIILTRFPRDAAARYAAETDFADWSDRLEIHGVDLRHTPSVEELCAELLRSHSRLDFLINNACQTVRRPSGFYGHLMDAELRSSNLIPAAERKLLASDHGPRQRHVLPAAYEATDARAALLSQVPLVPEDLGAGGDLFPAGQLDADLQQVDLRTSNSWRLMLDEVPAVELLEVQLVNAVAPFVLNGRLRPLMKAVSTEDKHIVNVSAMEGQFYRALKTARHPHTNMAKAALNMMTRTSAPDYVEDGIHMNSVDTGWVTDEDPALHAARKIVEHAFSPPLDIVDGAARIVAPIFDGLNTGEHAWGVFFKDYKVTDW